MRLCAALALVLVALLVVTFKVVRRHRRHVAPPTPETEVVEIVPPAPPVRAPAPRAIVRRAPPRVAVPPVLPAEIVGRLRLPDDVDATSVEIVARPSGSPRPDSKGRASEGGFRIADLVAGQRYDLEFRGDRVRTLAMMGVVAPARDLDVELELRATIHVAIGFPRGGQCPIDSVFAHVGAADSGEGLGILSFSEDCRFDFDAPVSAGLVTIVAEGSGVRFDAAVTVPDHGDPEPICLNPPCRANPLDGLARLRFILDGAARDTKIRADVRPAAPGATARYGCRSSAPTCEIEGLEPGDFSIDVVGPGCGAGPMTISVAAGDNDVTVPCLAPTAPEDDAGEAMSAEIDEGA